MSQQSEKPKFHTVTLRSKNPDSAPVGANTEILLDGKPLLLCRRVEIVAVAGGVNRVTLELYAHAEVNVLGEFATKIVPLRRESEAVGDGQ